MTSERVDRRIQLGHIGPAHGLKGEVVITSFTAEPTGIASYGPLSDEAGTRTFTILSVRAAGKGLVARLEGIGDRTAAEALRGTKLYIARDRLPPPEAGEYYVTDLIGLPVVRLDGSAAGTIVAVPDFGAGDLLEIRPEGGGETYYVPFADKHVPEVDIANRRVVIDFDMPEGGRDEEE